MAQNLAAGADRVCFSGDKLLGVALRQTPAGPVRPAGKVLAALAARLPALPTAVVGRTAENALWLDLRCLAGIGDASAQAAEEVAFAALFSTP